jgi:hypothetical protein
VGWHQVGGAFLGQAVDQERQVTCGEVPERICVNLGIFSKGAKQRAPRKRAEPLPKMGAPAELTWGQPQVGTIPNQIGATPRLAPGRTKLGPPAVCPAGCYRAEAGIRRSWQKVNA